MFEGLTKAQMDLTDEVIDFMTEGLRKQQAKGRYTRSAHAKTLGLMKAEFRVLDDLPEKCRHGIFASPRTFKAFVRSSSSCPHPQPDKVKDARGMAIKLLEVEGKRFAHFNCEKATQDFVLVSWPAFFFKDLHTFVPASKLFLERKVLSAFWFLLRSGEWKSIYYSAMALRHQPSLLEMQYWSITPYKFGDTYVKYTVIPTSPTKSQLPSPLTNAYLSQNLDRSLQEEDVTFDFCLQFYKDDQKTSLTNNLQIWKQQDSPYIKVAELTFPKQHPGTQEKLAFGENLCFSPAHCLDAHQPIGDLNYARLRVYKLIAEFRHQANGTIRNEPTHEDFDRF